MVFQERKVFSVDPVFALVIIYIVSPKKKFLKVYPFSIVTAHQINCLKMASCMGRNLYSSEIMAKSEFYLDSTYKVLNNTIDRVLTLQLFLIGLNMSTVQICLKNAYQGVILSTLRKTPII